MLNTRMESPQNSGAVVAVKEKEKFRRFRKLCNDCRNEWKTRLFFSLRCKHEKYRIVGQFFFFW